MPKCSALLVALQTAPEASESSAQLGLLDRRQTRQDTEAKAANVNNVTSPTAAGPGFVSPVAIASDASPQPRFPFPLLKQVSGAAYSLSLKTVSSQ